MPHSKILNVLLCQCSLGVGFGGGGVNLTVFHPSPALSASQRGRRHCLCTFRPVSHSSPSSEVPTHTSYLACVGCRHLRYVEWWIRVILLQVLICIQLLFLLLETSITVRTAWRINAGRSSLSRNRNGETTVIMLLEMHFSQNNHHLPFPQVKHIKRPGKEQHDPRNPPRRYSDSLFFQEELFH